MQLGEFNSAWSFSVGQGLLCDSDQRIKQIR